MNHNISIAMATYNGARYIRKQLDSILLQTIPFDEIIVCDDASTDGTWDIITEYVSKDTRIKAYRNEQNIGFVANFENVLRRCSGDYIALSDQDDVWKPEHLEILQSEIGDKILAVGDAEIMCANGQRTGQRLSYLENLDYIPEDDLSKAYTIFFYRGCVQGASMLLSKKLLSKALPIPDNGIYHDVWLSALACFYGGIQRINDIITLYRRHDKAVTGNRRRHTKIRTLIGHVLLNRALQDRWILVPTIRERLGKELNKEQRDFLNEAEKYYLRRRTFLGRIRNFFFDLKHYKLIYA